MLKLILVATDFEVKAVLENREFGYKRIAENPFELWRNDVGFLLVTGIGLVNSALGFNWALRNLNFCETVNIGAAGICTDDSASMEKHKKMLGNIYEISKVRCLEPYNEAVYELSEGGVDLVSASRPVVNAEARKRASEKGKLVDMECYALASTAKFSGKKLSAYKLATDFSPECDIHKNIIAMQNLMLDAKNIWI